MLALAPVFTNPCILGGFFELQIFPMIKGHLLLYATVRKSGSFIFFLCTSLTDLPFFLFLLLYSVVVFIYLFIFESFDGMGRRRRVLEVLIAAFEIRSEHNPRPLCPVSNRDPTSWLVLVRDLAKIDRVPPWDPNQIDSLISFFFICTVPTQLHWVANKRLRGVICHGFEGGRCYRDDGSHVEKGNL